MKYKSVIGIASCIGELLYLHTNYPQTEAITFIPMSTPKQRVRGFNQTEKIAQRFAQLTEIPCRTLLKKTSTQLTSQAKQSTLQERKQNFEAQSIQYIFQHPPPRSVLLIDDVYTTGQTMNSCAKILLEHGVKEVHGLALAHGR
jgi:predicted amidophosphoribosyltransferase